MTTTTTTTTTVAAASTGTPIPAGRKQRQPPQPNWAALVREIAALIEHRTDPTALLVRAHLEAANSKLFKRQPQLWGENRPPAGHETSTKARGHRGGRALRSRKAALGASPTAAANQTGESINKDSNPPPVVADITNSDHPFQQAFRAQLRETQDVQKVKQLLEDAETRGLLQLRADAARKLRLLQAL